MKRELAKLVAQMIKNEFSKAQLASAMNIQIAGKQDVFDALVKSKRATDFYDAVSKVAAAVPAPDGVEWADLASFAAELERADPLHTERTVQRPAL